jgi:hypothetical protein
MLDRMHEDRPLEIAHAEASHYADASAELLREAERIARERHINLSAVATEAIASGLKKQASAAGSQRALDLYRRAFQEFTADELSILDGIDLGIAARPNGD